MEAVIHADLFAFGRAPIGCANVASLPLARGMSRRIGSAFDRCIARMIVRQLLTESVVSRWPELCLVTPSTRRARDDRYGDDTMPPDIGDVRLARPRTGVAAFLELRGRGHRPVRPRPRCSRHA
jgi:hypothetical protein